MAGVCCTHLKPARCSGMWLLPSHGCRASPELCCAVCASCALAHTWLLTEGLPIPLGMDVGADAKAPTRAPSILSPGPAG